MKDIVEIALSRTTWRPRTQDLAFSAVPPGLPQGSAYLRDPDGRLVELSQA